jgi:NTP pyrophosphatase (non-canonical NTP hydrolase)
MDLRTLQDLNRKSVNEMKAPFRSGPEVLLALTEELGEVAQEVALLEQVGSKAEWVKQPSVDRLAEELAQLLNLVAVLANVYKIDLTHYVDR